MKTTEKNAIFTAAPAGIWYGGAAGFGALVKSIDGDYVSFVFVAGDEKTAHKTRIYETTAGRYYFRVYGRRVYFDEVLRYY